MAKKKTLETAPATTPEKRPLTPAEQRRLADYQAKDRATPNAAKWKGAQREDGTTEIRPKSDDDPDNFLAAVAAATGSVDHDMTQTLLRQVQAAPVGASTVEDQTNRASAMLTEIGPRDGLEGMLAVQMVTTHNAALECLRRAHLADQPTEGRKLNLSFADRLLRTFTAQMETLGKYRGKGKQEVVVVHKHVHVHQGGQAIVADNLTTGGGVGDGTLATESIPCARAIEATGEALLVATAGGAEVWSEVQEDGEAVPSPGHGERAL